MPRRQIAFLVLAALAAALFVRLGVWQLSRRAERRARNAVAAARLAAPPVDVAAIPSDTARARFRRVTLTGVYDYAHELVLAGRTHDGSPGVNLITPLRLPAPEAPAVLVNRGWVYSPDGATTDRARWREAEGPVRLGGYVETFPGAGRGRPTPSRPGVIRRLDRAELSRLIGYPLAAYYVVLQGEAAGPRDSSPARVEPPALDEGPHLSYAIQWFAFALIAVVGAATFARADARRRARVG